MIIKTPLIPTEYNYSIFLAGPTPRNSGIPSWRLTAVQYLEEMEFSGQVFSPEPIDRGLEYESYQLNWRNDEEFYKYQMEWEHEHLEKATCILFWIPRNLETLPGFTTNIEFGEYLKSGKIVVGFPASTPKTKYIKEKCLKYNIPVYSSLKEVIGASILMSMDNGSV